MADNYEWVRDAVMGVLIPALVYLFLRVQKLDVQVALNKQAIDAGAAHHENELAQFRRHLEKIENSLDALTGVFRDGLAEMRTIHESSQANFNKQIASLSRDILAVATGHGIEYLKGGRE